MPGSMSRLSLGRVRRARPGSGRLGDSRRPLLDRVRALFVLATLFCAHTALALESFADVKAAYRSSESSLLDRHGEPINMLRTDLSVRRFAWTALEQVSPAFVQTLLLSEDKRFYQHAGVDWSAVASAAVGNLSASHVRGASTITMQLAGLLENRLRTRSHRSMMQKLDQAAVALAIERHWSKAEILEAYLNLVDFRGETVGIGALSVTLFEKLPSGLNTREAALGVAMIRSPNAPLARVVDRACAILKEEQQPDSCAGLLDYLQILLSRHGSRSTLEMQDIAPHLAQHLLAGRSGEIVRSTLDASLQRVAIEALRQQMAELAGRNVGDGAVVVLDNASGDVLAYVGSSGSYSKASNVDNVLAPRQAGSTLKPFLYELALEQRWLTAASLLDDSPVDLKTQAGLYIPQDYDHHFKGLVSVRTALGSSLNVPAVRTLVLVTPNAFQERLKRLGFSLRETGDYYGYSLALGSAEVNLLALTNAYRTLANRGTRSAPRFLAGGATLAPVEEVMKPAATFIISDILSDRNARAATFGLGNVLETRYWSAVKTGTSKDMRDNWCIGFSERYTVGVWVGNDSGQPMWDVSGVTGAAPIWHTVMDYLDRRDPSISGHPDTTPPGIVANHISFASQLEPERDEYFLSGTETRVIEPARQRASAKRMIASPADGTIVALDPDIPGASQRLKLRAVPGPDSATRWRLDGKLLGDGPELDWPLWPGRHHLELLNAKNQVVDQLQFEVRGASLKHPA